jgi:hypothetical protein
MKGAMRSRPQNKKEKTGHRKMDGRIDGGMNGLMNSRMGGYLLRISLLSCAVGGGTLYRPSAVYQFS